MSNEEGSVPVEAGGFFSVLHAAACNPSQSYVCFAAAEDNAKPKDAATFSLTAVPSEEEVEEVIRQVKERGDEGALAADILEDLNTDSIRSLRRSFDVIGGDDGVQEGEFVKMMMAYLDPDDGTTRLTGEVGP